tara:strand:- start:56 stop:1732 length:1677 start_codon:yes stop_codon:yes gene_type:complete
MKRFFLIFSFAIISLFSFSQNIEGKWNFDYILPETIEIGENLKPISDGDAMQINTDGSFHYKISEAELIADGSWELNENNLSFHYTFPEKITRIYKITSDENSLVLNENGINYAFLRSEIAPAIIATSGITLTSIFRGILGLISLLLIAFLFSRNRKEVNWTLVAKGLAIQILFALLILKVSIISFGFEFVGKIFTKIISFTQDGTMFLFRSFETGLIESPLMNFVVMILPTVIFFSALTSLFYYWRIIPKIVYGFAWLMKRIMRLSGPESVAVAGNIFLGQTESPLLVKPYLDKMTMSEMLCLMSGGMATIAGGVLAAYIGFLGGDDPVQQIMFAKHLLAASVMSAPAAVVAAKILLPETEEFEEKLEITSVEIGSNALEAISKGTTDGLRLAVNVGAMLLVFIALISMANYILFKVGDWTDLNSWIAENTRYPKLSFNMILGYIFAPIAWLMGVCKEDMFLVGQLLGEKTVLNEFVAYVSLGEMKEAEKFFEEKSIIIATYILCGFANFASIGIQIGGIGALAPKRRGDLSRLGILALIAGTLASLFTAVIVGMIL